MIKRLLGSMFLSGLLHLGLFAVALLVISWSETRSAPVTIDLGASSLLLHAPSPKGARARPAPPSKLWYLAAKGRPAPLPTPEPQQVSVTPESENAAAPCPPPCPDSYGDWVSAASLSVKPAWSEGMITEDDYPADMRRGHKEGVVVVEVLIDVTGKVRGVNLEKGADPEFNNLVVERLAHSSFSPARNQSGMPVACRARIPIQFQLQ